MPAEVACLHTRSNRLVGGRRKLRTSATQLHLPDKRGKWRPFRFQPKVVDSRLNDLLDGKRQQLGAGASSDPPWRQC